MINQLKALISDWRKYKVGSIELESENSKWTAARCADALEGVLLNDKHTGTSEIKAEDKIAFIGADFIVQRLQGLVDKWHEHGSPYSGSDFAKDIKTLISELQPPPKFKRGELLHSKYSGKVGFLIHYGTGHCTLSYSSNLGDSRFHFPENTDELEPLAKANFMRKLEALAQESLEQRIADQSDSQA